MKLKTRLMLFTAALAFSAGMARAAITGNDVVRSYQAADYSYIEVKEGPTQIKVEAIKDGVRVEVVYDRATGDAIRSESHAAPAGEAGRTGVEVRTTSRDFVAGSDDDSGSDDVADDSGDDDHGGHDDGPGHDAGDDHGGDNDGSDDGAGHDAGDDHGGDDHGGDDHGGSDHGGSDHGSDDDHGGSDHGSDDDHGGSDDD